MKKLFTILLITTFIFSCKKKKEEPVDNTPVPVTKDISIKINGMESNCSSCAYSTLSGTARGMTFDFPDSDDLILLNFYMRPLVGSYALVRQDYTYKNLVTLSIKKDGQFYSAVTGTINVSNSDTTSTGAIKRLVAGLKFSTDTVNGKSLNVTDGVIDFTKQ